MRFRWTVERRANNAAATMLLLLLPRWERACMLEVVTVRLASAIALSELMCGIRFSVAYVHPSVRQHQPCERTLRQHDNVHAWGCSHRSYRLTKLRSKTKRFVRCARSSWPLCQSLPDLHQGVRAEPTRPSLTDRHVKDRFCNTIVAGQRSRLFARNHAWPARLQNRHHQRYSWLTHTRTPY